MLPVVPDVIPPFAGNELHPNSMTLSLPDSPPISGHGLIEDDDKTVYKPVRHITDDVDECLEDSLTITDDDPSDVTTVHDDSESLTIEMPLAPKNGRVKSQVPFEVTVDVTSPATAENLNQSDEVKELLNIMKDPLSELNKEWASIHHQLKHVPHSKMMRLVKAGHLDKKFLKVNKIRCPDCIIAT